MAKKKADTTVAAPKPLRVRRVSLTELHSDPSNVNKHDAKNLHAIRDSLKEFGQVEPLVVQKGTGRVIGGNGRLEVMRDLGITDCDVVEVEADNVRATALAIALNRTAKLSVFDDEALAQQLRALQSEDFDLSSVGFDAGEVDALIEGLAGEIVPDFVPASEDEQGRLDEKAKAECPNCGCKFAP